MDKDAKKVKEIRQSAEAQRKHMLNQGYTDADVDQFVNEQVSQALEAQFDEGMYPEGAPANDTSQPSGGGKTKEQQEAEALDAEFDAGEGRSDAPPPA